jgi:hypothetical protein
MKTVGGYTHPPTVKGLQRQVILPVQLETTHIPFRDRKSAQEYENRGDKCLP